MNRDLFLAVLAMDAYNRGYDAGLEYAGSGIGYANAAADTEHLPGGSEAESFYAVSYTLTSAVGDLANGSKIVSFRGTDDTSLNFSPTDLEDWFGGAGWQTDQGELAAEFYRSVVNTNANAQNLYNSNVTFTGHSLGGGLAGLLASLYGKKAVIYDNMAFNGAAENIHHHATTPTIEVTAGTETYTEPNPFHQPVLDTYYGTASPAPLNQQQISGYQVDDQALQGAQSTGLVIGSTLDKGGLGPVDLHSMSLLVILLYAQQNAGSIAGWDAVSAPLLNSLFDDQVGGSIGTLPGGSSSASEKLRSMIAYSAVSEGERPFGDTAIRAMFDDAAELANAAYPYLVSSLTDFTDPDFEDVVSIIVQHAGKLAREAIVGVANAPEGVAQGGNGSVAISVDKAAGAWNLGGATTPAIIGFDSFATTLLSKILNANPALPTSTRQQIEAAISDAKALVLGKGGDTPLDAGSAFDALTDGYQITDKANASTLVVGTYQNDTIIGTGNVDLIYAGSSRDSITGGSGADILIGGGGNDTLYNGNSSGSDDNAADMLNGGSGFDIYRVGAGDRIIDEDGKGAVFLGNHILKGGKAVSEGSSIYKDAKGNLYEEQGGNLVITLKTGGTVTIENWEQDKLGIHLGGGGGPPGGGGGLGNQPSSPLIIDLDGNGVQSTSLATSKTYFDLDTDGFAERTAWVSPTDGLLVLDRNGNGTIDNQTELFGTKTSNGFTILAPLDENADGLITAADAAFADLRVWRDGNSDGKSTPEELLRLSELGITSIDAVGVELPAGTLNNGNTVSHRGIVTFEDGHTAAVDDVWFEHTTTDTRVNLPTGFEYSDLATLLPDIEGKGHIPDLKYAVTIDPELAAMVKQLVLDAPTLNGDAFRAAFEAVVLKWAGVEGIDPTSRGDFVDARHLAVLEKAYVEDYIQKFGVYAGTSNAGWNAAYGLELKFDELVDKLMTDFSVQIRSVSLDLNELTPGSANAAFDAVYTALNFFRYDNGAAEVLDFGASNMASIIAGFMPESLPEAIKYIDRISTALAGFSPEGTTRESWAGVAFSEIENVALREYAVQRFVSGTSPIGTAAAEQLIVTDPSAASYWNTNARTFSSAIWSGQGDDTVGAGAGADTYLFLKGDGQDTVVDDAFQGAGGNYAVALPQADDRVIFADRNADQAVYTIDGAALVITFNDGSSDSVRLEDFFTTRTTTNPTSEYVVDGVNYGSADEFMNEVTSNVGRIEIFQFADQEVSFTDVLASLRQQNQTLGDDTIIGFDIDETINGGMGDDFANGGEGSDTYVFFKGDGSDTYVEAAYPATADISKFSTDTIHFADATFSELNFARNGSALTISFDDINLGQVTINNQPLVDFDNYATYATGEGIEYLTFADGSRLSLFQAQVLAGFTPPAMAIRGEANANAEGVVGEYEDHLYSTLDLRFFYMSSVFYGGNGELTLKGGFGDDTYIFNSTNAKFTINDTWWEGALSRPEAQGLTQDILFLQDLSLSDIAFERGGEEGDDLILIHNGQEIVRVSREFVSGIWNTIGNNNGIELIVDKDGNTLDRNEIADLTAYVGTNGDDYMPGAYNYSQGSTYFYANDQLRGGLGDDTLDGGNGSDRYYYRSGDGNDIIHDFSNTYYYNPGNDVDTLYLENLTKDQVRIEIVDIPMYSSDEGTTYYIPGIVIRDLTTGQMVQLVGNYDNYGLDENLQNGGDSSSGIEKIVFADGTELNRQEIFDLAVYYGSSGNDSIQDVAGKVMAGAGDDIIIGYRFDEGFQGQNALIYNLGDGNDQIENIDVLKFLDVNSDAVSIVRSGYDLEILFNATGEKITEKGYFLTAENFAGSDFARTVQGGFFEAIPVPDVDSLTYEAQLSNGDALPSWLLFDEQTRQFTGTAPVGLVGPISIDVSAYHYFFLITGTKTISLDVVNGQVDYTIPEDLFIQPGSVNVDVQATLVDGSPLPAWLQFDAATNMISGTAPTAADLPVSVMLTVTIGELNYVETFNLESPTFDAFTNGSDLSRIEFADGVALNQDQIFSLAVTNGSNADDTIVGTIDDEILLGLEGNDSISGGDGNDVLIGGSGSDSLSGGDGNDRFEASEGDDDQSVDGGTGEDTLDLSRITSGVTVDLAAGQVTGQGYTVATISSVEAVIGTRGNDTLLGSASSDKLDGHQGDDTVDGRDGDDLISGGAGADNLVGGLGFDTLSYEGALSGITINLDTGLGSRGDASGDTVSGFERVLGSNYDDDVTGSTQSDVLVLNAGDDVANGLQGDDDIFGDAGDDEIHGAAGDDQLYGGAGDDELSGDEGDDQLDGGSGNDTMIGGTGDDTYVVQAVGDVVTENADEGSDTIESSISIAALTANVENLILTGTSALNGIGNTLNNVITGNSGANSLSGGDGDDLLNGGAGNDTLAGGSGADTFNFVPGFGLDTVSDFQAGAGLSDVIGLSLGSDYDTFEEVMAAASQVGSDTVITIDASNKITLAGVLATALVADDFLFA